jgi:uncharacterized membrane protein
MSARKIAAWHDAGLIDAKTRDHLIAYEAFHARPLALWAVFGIGALAIGLGLVSVIAANWEDIPGTIRLALHLALIITAVAVLLLREERLAEISPWSLEALLFIAGALGLTFFGHIGQVYQTSSPMWRPLATWLLLFAPLLVLMGRSWLMAAAVMGVAIWCAWDYAMLRDTLWMRLGNVSKTSFLWLAFVTSAPVLAAPVAAWLRGCSARGEFWRRIEQVALAYAVGGASLVSAAASAGSLDDGDGFFDLGSMLVRAAIGLLAGIGLVLARPGPSGQMAGLIIVSAGLAMPLALAADGYDLAAALLFMMLWAGIAAAALAASWRGVFQMAVGVIAFRLIILSFELASDLLLSGFGLIFSGLLILGVAWAALKVSRSFAPASAGAFS